MFPCQDLAAKPTNSTCKHVTSSDWKLCYAMVGVTLSVISIRQSIKGVSGRMDFSDCVDFSRVGWLIGWLLGQFKNHMTNNLHSFLYI
jgi:hypothetical protein